MLPAWSTTRILLFLEGSRADYGQEACVKSVEIASFDDVSLERLRQRKSEKWSTYPADVLPAFVAEMDFALAPPVQEVLHRAIELGDCGYASIDELGATFGRFMCERFNWRVEPRSTFAVPDVMAGVTESLRALTDADSGVVINPPVYPPFFEVIRAAGRRLVEVPLICAPGGRWNIDFDALERAFAAGAQAYLLCSPHNPVGRVWCADELVRISTLANAYGVAVISDEVHAPLTMPGVEYVPFLRIAGEHGRCVALASASKAWNIAGLKCALIVTGADDVRTVVRTRLKNNPTETRWRVGHLGSLGNVAAFRDGVAWLDELRAYLDGNRRLLRELLQQHIPQVRYIEPQASYLAWIDCSALSLGRDPAALFLSRGRVALESGYKFGKQGEQYVRVNMGTSRAILTEIVSRMASAL